MDFEINKTATPCLNSTVPPNGSVKCTFNRSVNDILVTYDLTGGGGNPTIGLRAWNGSSWQTSSTVVSESAVNAGNVTDTHLLAGARRWRRQVRRNACVYTNGERQRQRHV